MSIFITSPKKGDSQSAQRTALLHYFLMLVRFSFELFKKTCIIYGIRNTNGKSRTNKRAWTREQIDNVCESWTAQGSTTIMSIYFIDYTNYFDSVQHLKMWNGIRSVGITKHWTGLL